MVGILEEVNYPHANPKLVKCLAVHNEEDWVEYNLANNYEEFDIIRVIEGAVRGRPGSTEDGHSTDSTLDRIRNFPDPDGKIELIQLGRFFKSLEEQKQVFLELASEGEWLFIVDCDEFYMEGDIERVRKAIKSRPTATEIIPTFLHFYRDFSHVKAPHPEWKPQHQRIIRYRNGLRYHAHPIATDVNGQCTYFTGSYQPSRYTIPHLWIYHYGHAKGKEFHKMKKKFYDSELEKHGASAEIDEKFAEFMEGTEPLDTILEYDGPHPAALDDHPQRHEVSTNYVVSTENTTLHRGTFTNWKDNFVYGAEELPNMALMMMGQWQTTQPFYNVLEV
jgi:hypothetical protein